MTRDEIIKDRADWLLDAVATATQNRQFLRGEPEYDEVAGEAILLNGEKAIRIALDRLEALTAPKTENFREPGEFGEGTTVRRVPVVTDEMAAYAWLAYDSTPNDKMRAAIEAALKVQP